MEITGNIISLLTSLGGAVAVWVALNNKVTRLETVVEFLKSENTNVRKDFNTVIEEIKEDQKEIMKALHDLRILIEKKADR